MPTIGVLAMQGAFAEHVRALEESAPGVTAVEVRTLAQLDRLDGIVIPGGESTAIRKALDRCGLLTPLRDRIAAGLPSFGTCAGMIVLADAPLDGAPPCFGLLDIDVVRNGFGRQGSSAEELVDLVEPDAFGAAHTMRGVFIRAPRITRVGETVRVLATLRGEPVIVRQGTMLAASFHPELTSDRTLHRAFVELVVARG